MPELPEVEVAARSLRPLIVGRRVEAFAVHDTQRIELREPERLLGRVVHQVRRIGKRVVFDLDRDTKAPPRQRLRERLWLAVHLRMTGRLLHHCDESVPRPPHYVRATWRFDDGCELAFVDPRRFGTVTLHQSRAELTPLGVEPLSRAFTVPRLAALLQGSTSPLKVWLLRQDRLVGLGNIYASEILFEAGLPPTRPAGSLRAGELERLHAATREVLRRAIHHCGTTFSDFQDAHGELGSYQDCLNVYGRDGEPCRVCGTPVQRMTQAGRSTFWCPACQR